MTQIFSQIDFDNSKIKHGERPTPSVLNRPLLASMDADARLDATLQYVGKIMSPNISDYTKFLLHCDDVVDVVGGAVPISNMPTSEIFIKDNFMRGTTLVQSTAINLFSTLPDFNSELTTSSTLTEISGSIHTTMFNRKGLTITNKDTRGDIVAGVVAFRTPTIPAMPLASYSYGVEACTEDNLERMGVIAGCTLTFLDSAGTVVHSVTASTVDNAFDGRLYTEAIHAPASASNVYATVYVNYGASYSKASVTFRGLMLEEGPTLHTWVGTTRGATTLYYERVATSKMNQLSAIFWAKISDTSIVSHGGESGPLFVTNDASGFSLGVVHSVDDTNNAIFRLMLKNNSTVSYGSSIVLTDAMLGTYVPCVLRMAYISKTGKIKLAFATVDENYSVIKSELEVDAFDLPADFDLHIGADGAARYPLNAYVTEVRVDEEWLNDLELIIIALARSPFSLGVADGIDIQALREYLDNTGINLIVNPDGKLGLNHWAGAPEGKFTNVTKDYKIGSGFMWYGGQCASDTYIGCDTIKVTSNETYTFRAIMEALASSSGDFGIAVRFFRTDGTQTGTTHIEKVTQGYTSSYYELVAQAPPDATNAVAYMYVSGGFNSTRATWSKLKFELGEGTMFTDDSTIGHSVYA